MERLPGRKGLLGTSHLLERLSKCPEGPFHSHPNATEVHTGRPPAKNRQFIHLN